MAAAKMNVADKDRPYWSTCQSMALGDQLAVPLNESVSSISIHTGHHSSSVVDKSRLRRLISGECAMNR